MYKLTGVTRNFRKGRQRVEALRGVDLTIGDGEWLAIQGPTGHGKTTLLQILGGLDRPSAGTVEFDGRHLAAMREGGLSRIRAGTMGFIFQTFNLVPTLSAQESVVAGQAQRLAVLAEGRVTTERIAGHDGSRAGTDGSRAGTGRSRGTHARQPAADRVPVRSPQAPESGNAAERS